jgi:hypothetical protein
MTTTKSHDYGERLVPICENFVTIKQLAQSEVSWTRHVITETMSKIEVGEIFFMPMGSEDNGQSGYEPCVIVKIEQFWARYAHILVEQMDGAGRTITTTPYWIYKDLLHIPYEYLDLALGATHPNFEFTLQD